MFVCDDVERNSFGFFSPLSCVYAFGDRCGIYSILSSFLFSQLVVNMWTWMRHECVWEWICVCIKATPLSGFAFFAFSNPIRLSLLFVGMICIVAIQTVMFDISSSSSSSSRERAESLCTVSEYWHYYRSIVCASAPYVWSCETAHEKNEEKTTQKFQHYYITYLFIKV